MFQLCLSYQITPNQLYLVYCFKNNITPPLISLEQEVILCKIAGLLDADNKLTDKAEGIITDCETYFKKTKVKVTSQALGKDYQGKVKMYREIFPTGSHPTLNYTFRCSIEDLTPRFTWFFNRYPEYNWDLVLEATHRHVRKCGDNGYRGLGKSNYFIKKTDRDSNTITSPLADACQDILDGGFTPSVPDMYVSYDENNL
jgi:hypothetical protein